MNASGLVLSHAVYDAYGVETVSSTPAGDNFGYNARWGYYFDREIGLYLCQHRFYDPRTGRWLTRDPIGFAGGVSLYGCVGGSPVGNADPSGLVKITVYWYHVMGGGYHYGLIIEDNVVGSSTYGKKWVVAGHPETAWHPNSDADLVCSVGFGISSYDVKTIRSGRGFSSFVLRDDSSRVEPYLKGARAVQFNERQSPRKYSPFGPNSNTVFSDVLAALGLVGDFNGEIGRRKKAGNPIPWAPGIWAPKPPRPSKYPAHSPYPRSPSMIPLPPMGP
jgi:RHS repeat-associated protein